MATSPVRRRFDVILGHQHVRGPAVGLGIRVAQPGELESRPGRGRGVRGLLEVVGRRVLRLEGRHEGRRPLVVPERGMRPRRDAVAVDQHGAVHLPAGTDRVDALRRARHRNENPADRLDHARPPAGDGLLGPAEGRNDLVLFDGRDRQDGAGRVDERGPARCRWPTSIASVRSFATPGCVIA